MASCRNDSIREKGKWWSLKKRCWLNSFSKFRWWSYPSCRLIMQTWLRNNVMRFPHPAAVTRFIHSNVNTCCFLAICWTTPSCRASVSDVNVLNVSRVEKDSLFAGFKMCPSVQFKNAETMTFLFWAKHTHGVVLFSASISDHFT